MSSISQQKLTYINIGDLIKGRYEIVKRLGQGGFGAVYEVHDKKNKDFPYALKAELRLPNDDEPGLELEIGVLKEMKNCPKMVRYIDDGLLGPYRYIIMQLAGRNLSDLRMSYPQKHFTLNTSLQVSLQCLGRYDDVWCWLYMSIEFVKGKLPWRNYQDEAKVGLMKAMSKEILLANMESEYRTIYESLEKLTFVDEPPYHAYRTSLNHIMFRKKFTGNEPLDWEEKVAEAVNVVPFEKENAKNEIIQEPLEGEVKEEGQEP